MSFKYYDEHADKFFNDTVHVNMNEFYEAFLPLVKKEGRILDIGCGSGRDIKAFLDRGFDVVGFDASDEMVKKARQLTNGVVLKAKFADVAWEDEFDGLWASASLLHVPVDNIPPVLQKLWKALRKSSPFFMSFKYGDRQYEKDGRIFQNFTEKTIEPILTNIEDLNLRKMWRTVDKRKNRSDEFWLNIIVYKV